MNIPFFYAYWSRHVLHSAMSIKAINKKPYSFLFRIIKRRYSGVERQVFAQKKSTTLDRVFS
jgi:hypothetical protein